MMKRTILLLIPVLLSACGASKPPQLPGPTLDSLDTQIKHTLAEFDTLSKRLSVLEAGGIVPAPKTAAPIIVPTADPEMEAIARQQLKLTEEILELLHRAVVTPAVKKK